MRRPHPYLAIAAVCAAVLLVTLALAARGETMPVPAGIRTPVPNTEDCLPYINGFIVWPGSPQCQPTQSHFSVPRPDRLGALRHFTVRTIEGDIIAGTLTTTVYYPTVLAEARVLDPRFVDRPIYGTFAATPPALPPNCGDAWCGCAVGIGSWPPAVDASQPADRVEKLVVWETTNAILGRLNRPDLWDNAYVSSVVTRVGQQMGGWATN